MYIILSQKIDTESSYKDQPFISYHYPARYRNAIHVGDHFIYSQGNRYDKSQRYYFGAGVVGSILKEDDDNYYTALLHCVRFSNKVPITMENGKYIEQLGYEGKRNIPPWQNAIRPISQETYEYIIDHAGELISMPEEKIEDMEECLKSSIREYFVRKDESAIIRIMAWAASLAEAKSL